MSGSLVKEIVIERENIDKEIQICTARLKQLRLRRNQIDEKVLEYIDSTGFKGVYLDETNASLIKSTSVKRTPLPKKDKIAEACNVLQKYGINNPEQVYNEIIEAGHGEENVVSKLKTKRVKAN